MSSPTMSAFGRGDTEVCEGGGEERRGGFAGDLRLDPGGPFQPQEEGPGVEVEAGVGAPVQVPVHGHEPGTASQVPEDPVQGLVAECSARSPEDDHIRFPGLFVDERHTRKIVTDVAGVDQQTAGTRVAFPQVRGGGGGCGEDVVDADGEARSGQFLGDRGAGPRGVVGDQHQRNALRAELPHGLYGAGQRLPGHREHTVDVDQDRSDSFHTTDRPRVARKPQMGLLRSRWVRGFRYPCAGSEPP